MKSATAAKPLVPAKAGTQSSDSRLRGNERKILQSFVIASERAAMSQLEDLLRDLVVANRILSNEDVVDAYGHISVRHPDNPKRFFMSRSRAPELVERAT